MVKILTPSNLGGDFVLDNSASEVGLAYHARPNKKQAFAGIPNGDKETFYMPLDGDLGEWYTGTVLDNMDTTGPAHPRWVGPGPTAARKMLYCNDDWQGHTQTVLWISQGRALSFWAKFDGSKQTLNVCFGNDKRDIVNESLVIGMRNATEFLYANYANGVNFDVSAHDVWGKYHHYFILVRENPSDATLWIDGAHVATLAFPSGVPGAYLSRIGGSERYKFMGMLGEIRIFTGLPTNIPVSDITALKDAIYNASKDAFQ